MRAARLRVSLRIEVRNTKRDAIANHLATPSGDAIRNIGHLKRIANPERRGRPMAAEASLRTSAVVLGAE